MSEADRLFEELGYKKIFEKHIGWYSTIYNSDDISIEFTSDEELIITNRSEDYKPAILSMKELEAEFGCRMDGINTAIRLGGKHKGYQWSRELVSNMKPLERPKSEARKVGQYTLEGELVKVYNTVRECRKDFANVSKVLKGLANHCKGYTFKYID